MNGHNFCSLCWLRDDFDKHGDLEGLKTQHGTACTDLQQVRVFPQELSQAPSLHISNLPLLRAFNFSTELLLATQVSNYFFFFFLFFYTSEHSIPQCLTQILHCHVMSALSQADSVSIFVLPESHLTCVTLGWLLILSGPQFLHLKNGDH